MSVQLSANISNSETSSIWQSSKYYLKNLSSSFKESLPKALPGASALINLVGLAVIIHPEPIFNNSDESDWDWDSSFVIQNHEQVDQIAQFYSSCGFNLDENIIMSSELKQKIVNAARESVVSYLNIINEFNQKNGTTVKLWVSLQETGKVDLFPTLGGSWSMSGPLIGYQLPPVVIHIEKQENQTPAPIYLNEGKITSQFSPLEKQFIIAHEFVHIMNNDSFTNVACKLATSVLSTLPWIMNYSNSSSWSAYLVQSYLQSLTIETVSGFFRSMLFRHLEQRADLEAMNSLGSSQGAKLLLNNLKNLAIRAEDFEHPSHEARLKVVEEWENKHSFVA